ncbi:MAG: rRNA pseudouridine synthase [Clostridium sp.]|nr:rRNA pseudouridine synthase [Clostridium sp.]
MEEMRLQKYIAKCGVTSRRKAEELIAQGRVSVNGSIVKQMGAKVGKKDCVKIDDNVIQREENKIYIALNKPIGYISSVKDQFGRPTVLDLVDDLKERIFPVGRLDYNSSGLIFLTNDGNFANNLTHPRYKVSKTYQVVLDGTPKPNDIQRFRQGLRIDDTLTMPAQFKILDTKGRRATAEITLCEGKNRQVRRMCDVIGCPVISLKRVSIGSVYLGDMEEGKWRILTEKEVKSFE